MVAHPVPAFLATATFALAIALASGPARAAEDRAGLVEMLDADANGRLSQHEVRMTALAPNFTALDVNGDGTLDRRELRAIGVRMPPRPAARTP